MFNEKKMEKENKEKFETEFVVIYKKRYFGINFEKKQIKEITFEEAFGSSFFDWDTGICIASDWSKQQYDIARNKDGCGWIGNIVCMTIEERK